MNNRSLILLIGVPLILFGMWLRLINVTEIPMFTDEVRHIYRAQAILQGNVFEGLDQNKWLWGYVFSIFNPTGPESGWMARYFNTLWACISIAGTVALGRLLFSNWAGALAGLIYAIVPLATFHERQALTDPMMTALTTLSMVLSIRLARTSIKRRFHWAGLVTVLALSLMAARLVKPAMLPFLLLPPVAIVLFGLLPSDRAPLAMAFKRLSAALPAFAGWGAAVVVTLAAAAVVYQIAETQFDVSPRETHTVSFGNTIASGSDVYAALGRDVVILLDVVIRYIGWGVIVGIVLAVALAITTRRKWRAVLYLLLPALLFMVVPLIANRPTASGEIASRYLLINVSALAVLSAIGIVMAYQALGRWQPAAVGFLSISVIAVITQNAVFNACMISQPETVNWAPYDQRVYFDGGFGYPFEPAAEAMRAELEQSPTGRINVMSLVDVKLIQRASANIGPRVASIQYLQPQNNDEQRADLAQWMLAEEPIFILEAMLVEDVIAENYPNGPDGLIVERVVRMEPDIGPHNAYRVIGTRDPLASDIYASLGDAPAQFATDHDALAGIIDDSPAEVVVVYPHNHVAMVAERVSKPVQPLGILQYPLTQNDVQQALDTLELTQGDVIGVLTFDPPSSDPNRLLALTLLEATYPLQPETWQGLLNYRLYTIGTEADMQPNGAVFEGVLHLERAAVRRYADRVLVDVQWRTAAPVEDTFFTFTHVIDEAGTLIAQNDGIPGAGLYPFTQWEVEQPINDRYAIQLPSDLSPGSYQVITGIFAPESGLRLRITDGSDGGDFAVIGSFEAE